MQVVPVLKVPWEPLRMVRNGKGQIIENERAPLEFKEAEAKLRSRSREAAQLAEEARLMRCWVEAERITGRPEHELTWGRCVTETGLLEGTQK